MNALKISILIIIFIVIYKNTTNIKILIYDIIYYLNHFTWKANIHKKNENISNKKNKILIITYDNRDKPYIKLHKQNFQQYCKKWNIQYKFYTENKENHNVYWHKLYLVSDALMSNDYDFVMWVDSDTIIKNIDVDLNDIINKYNNDIITGYDDAFRYICAGVFIIKNSPIGRSFVKDCLDLHKERQYCLKNDNSLKGYWAGHCYEQGAMNELICSKYLQHTNALTKFFKSTSAFKDRNTLFLLHLSAPSNVRYECFKSIIDNHIY